MGGLNASVDGKPSNPLIRFFFSIFVQTLGGGGNLLVTDELEQRLLCCFSS
ncbi:MAG: hypothetical protein ACI9G1_002039 [Pirellulaceae bacterium]|jgi:hypothetical protein